MPTVEIVAIGSELLLGQIVDTNSAWIAERLAGLGVNMYYQTVVGDNPTRMKEVIDRALDRSDMVITSGGLGPTQDDLTRDVVAGLMDRPLVIDPTLLGEIENRFNNRGLAMSNNNRRQAYIPSESVPISNPNGTAPSFIVEDCRGIIFSLPGVPFEMKWLFENEVAPYLKKKFNLSASITHRILKITGLGESSVDELVGHLIAGSSNPTVGVLAHPGQVDVRITAKAPSRETADIMIEPIEKEIRYLLGNYIFATDDETMEVVVASMLNRRSKTIAVYEDVTGGMLANRISQANPDKFVGAIIGGGLNVIGRLIETPLVEGQSIDDDLPGRCNDLAVAIKLRTGADIGLAVHGTVDDSDQSENMAPGQVCISVTDGKNSKAMHYKSAGRSVPDRTRISLNAMSLVWKILLN